MKRFAASALAALMLLTVFASAAIAADDGNNTTASIASVVEIRGPVYNGSDLSAILANPAYGDGTTISMDANKFAAFFYDINNNVTTETLSIVKTPDTTGRTIGQHALVYSTTIEQTDYKYKGVPAWSNSTYSVLGFFADKYIPLKSNDASKLAKLVIDSKDKYTLKTGEKLDLGSGYSLTAKQVDVDGKKVWLELDNNGQYVDDQVVDTSNGDATWTDTHDKIQGEDTVQIFKVHVDSVFQGAVDSVAQIEGLWLIDYANAIKISTSDEFGVLNDVSINGPTINIQNKDTFTLSRDSEESIGQGMYFEIADSNDLRYYPYVQVTLGNGTGVGTTTGTPSTNETVTTPAATNETAPSENVTETVATNETPSAVGETPVAVANNTTTKPNTPGFEALPAIFGLLVIVYLVRRNK